MPAVPSSKEMPGTTESQAVRSQESSVEEEEPDAEKLNPVQN